MTPPPYIYSLLLPHTPARVAYYSLVFPLYNSVTSFHHDVYYCYTSTCFVLMSHTYVKKVVGFPIFFLFYFRGGEDIYNQKGFWRRAREWWRRIVFDSPSALCFLVFFFFVLSFWTMMACVCIILLLYSLYLPWPFRVWKKKEARAISIVPRVPTRANPIQSSRQLPPMHQQHHHYQHNIKKKTLKAAAAFYCITSPGLLRYIHYRLNAAAH